MVDKWKCTKAEIDLGGEVVVLRMECDHSQFSRTFAVEEIIEKLGYAKLFEQQESPLTPDAALKALVKSLVDYFWTEMGWEHFRAEFLANGDKEYENARLNNAKAISDFLNETRQRFPEFGELLGG